MDQNAQIDKQEQELDPAVERVRRKLMRLMLISLAVTMLLIVAVLAAVIYKIMRPAPAEQAHKPPLNVRTSTLIVPKNSVITTQSLEREKLALQLRVNNELKQIIIYDYKSAQIVGKILLKTE